eukprot:1848416-Amphidinium_carterae.1
MLAQKFPSSVSWSQHASCRWWWGFPLQEVSALCKSHCLVYHTGTDPCSPNELEEGAKAEHAVAFTLNISMFSFAG